MRIILIFKLDVKNIQFYEFVEQLHKLGKEIKVYDFVGSKRYDPVTKQVQYFNPFFGAKHILRIKHIRYIFKPLINKMVINREFKKDDIVNLHYVHPVHSKYAALIKKKVKLFLITFWGGDLLLANDNILTKYIPLLENCDIICGPPESKIKFLNIYEKYNERNNTNYNFDEKIRSIFFGISIFDHINKVNSTSIINFKEKYDLPKKDTIYITIGYNASPHQQHKLLIDQLKNLNKKLRDKIFLLIPLTYGPDEKYKKEVINHIKKSGINHHIFSNYIDMQELANLRIISNIFLSIQVDDGFSASVSESIFANNVVLVGDWLRYGIYEDWGIIIYRVNMESYERKLIDIIENLDDYLQQINGNSQIIYDKLSWNAMLPKWKELYEIN